MRRGLALRVAVGVVAVLSLAWVIGGCQAQPAPAAPVDRHAVDLTGSWRADYAGDDANSVTVTCDLYDDHTFRRVTTVTRGTGRMSVQQGGDPEVLSRTVVTGTWKVASGNEAGDGGTVQLHVSTCDGDTCGSDVDVGDKLELNYEVNDEGVVELDVAPVAPAPTAPGSPTAPNSPTAPGSPTAQPELTRQIPGMHVATDTRHTVDVSEYFAGATSYGARSSDASHLTVSVAGSVLTLTPVSATDDSGPVVVTVTASSGAGHIDVETTVHVLATPGARDFAEIVPGVPLIFISHIAHQLVVMGEPKTVNLTNYIHGRSTSYSAKSSDASQLTVSVAGSVLTLTPVSTTDEADPAVVTVTASSGGHGIEATFSVDVVTAVVTAVVTLLPLDCAANDYSNADLSGADLSGQTHTGCEMAGATLTGADLSGTTLSDSNLYSADLSNANLTDADFSGPDPYIGELFDIAGFIGVDLSWATLTGADLTRANLTGADLYGTTLTGVTVTDANFTNSRMLGANLSGSTLSGANLTRVDLYQANLAGAVLTGATLRGAVLYNADLEGATLTGSNLADARLDGLDLSNFDFSGANLSNTGFHGANLSGANLSTATLTGVDLFAADLSDANLSGRDLHGVNLAHADLSGATLTGANLSDANLHEADLGAATLTSADLTRAELYSADLTDADLSGATLFAAYLHSATLTGANLTGTNLAGAILTNVVGCDTATDPEPRLPGCE